MSETVSLDRKGRLVLPKKVRDEAHLGVNKTLVVRARGVGRVELFDPDILMAKAQQIASRKLVGWAEEDHEATDHIYKSMKRR